MNVLNRKLEEVYGVGKEFNTVAALWGVSEVCVMPEEESHGL
jgi:DASH complex subunit DAD1